ncbi:MAG: hypothetical protein AAGM67_09385 [Bacteroidota bacterium]
MQSFSLIPHQDQRQTVHYDQAFGQILPFKKSLSALLMFTNSLPTSSSLPLFLSFFSLFCSFALLPFSFPSASQREPQKKKKKKKKKKETQVLAETNE